MLKQYALLGRSYAMLYLLTGQKHYLVKARLLYGECQECLDRRIIESEPTIKLVA